MANVHLAFQGSSFLSHHEDFQARTPLCRTDPALGAQEAQENQTKLSEFLLLGLTKVPEMRFILLAISLILYLLTLAGNILLALAVWKDIHLQMPMYIFLCTLALSETLLSLAVVPKTLGGLVSPGGISSISFPGCMAQMFFASALASTNCFLLATMGYDCSVAIHDSLRYTTRMEGRTCVKLITMCSIGGFCIASGMTTAVFHHPFSPNRNHIQHFYCDILPLLELACGDIHTSEIALLFLCMLVLGLPLLLILLSYVYILKTVLKMSTHGSHRKAFSTCGAHLTVVVIHFGCASFMYFRPKTSYHLERDQLISVSYSVVTPLLNPMVYSLRNQEVHTALKKTLGFKVAER